MFTRALHRLHNRRPRRFAAVTVALALVAAPIVLLPSAASADPGSSLPGSPFNGSDGALDTTPAVAGHNDVGTPDTLGGGVKEDTDCPPTDGGSAPDKADIVTGYVASANGVVDGSPHTFLYLGWKRQAKEGTATIDFELNSGTVSCGAGSPFVKRVVGQDLLFTYDFQGGSTVGVQVRTWTSVHGGEWSGATTLPATKAEASINQPGQLIGELVVDMTAAGFFPAGICKGFSSAMVKSRASSASFNDQLKDIILPFPIEVTNCGNLEVTKTVAGPGTAADSFGFTVDCGSYDLMPTAAGDDLTFPLTNGGSKLIKDIPLDTVCSVSETDPGASQWSTAYTVGGGSAHGGLSASGVTIALGTKVVAFTNTRLTGSLTISKSAVGGDGTFLFDVDCTDNRFDRLGENPVSITTHSGAGSAVLSGIPTGTSCTVTERSNSLFTSSPASASATITGDGGHVAFTNTAKAIGITLDKKVNSADHATTGDALTVHEGDPLHYSVVITNSGDVPLTINSLADTLKTGFDTTCSQGVGSTLHAHASFSCSYDATAGSSDAHNVAGVAAVDGLGRNASASDGTYVHILAPAISVTKTGPPNVHVGDSIDYTIVVRNSGNTPLHNVTVSDPKCDAPATTSDNDGELGVGESWTYHCSHVALAGDGSSILNTAVAHGTDPLGNVVDGSADAPTDILKPIIEVTKTGPAVAHVGDTLAYDIVVHNGGNTPLTSVTVTDAKCIGLAGDGEGELGVNESWTYHCTHVVLAGDGNQYLNEVHVSGRDLLNKTVSDDDSWPTEILRPAIGVTKTGPGQVHVGDTATYTIVVTNAGNTPLHDVTVLDPKCDATAPSSSDDDGTLSPGESWTYHCTHVVVDGDGNQILNTATADGTDPLDEVVHGTANHPSDILRPAIAITKAGVPSAHVGDSVVYTLVVTNPGNTPLASVAVSDPKCDSAPTRSGTDSDGLLAPGESWTYQCTHVATAGDGASILNTALAQGVDPLGQTVTNTAKHTVGLLHPAITIVKTANPESVSVSGPVTYTYVVTNIGDTTLFQVLVTDDILGAIGAAGQLLPGESVTMAKTVDVDATTPPRNIGTAVGTDLLGQTVTATDDAIITVVLAEVLEQPELPRTGAPLTGETRAALALIEVGFFLTLAGRRRRGARRVG